MIKKVVFPVIAFMVLLLNSCTKSQSQVGFNLSAQEFAQKIKDLPQAPILDVRTPEEFENGHLANALNYDWNGKEFQQEIAPLDKTKPVLVYCLSGGRSAAAASQLRAQGFKEVYELDGGILKWRSAGFPETKQKPQPSSGMSKEEFQALITSDKMVLVDFYADWCMPCKKMKPFLLEIAEEKKQELVFIQINADQHPQLCKALKIEALPTLQVYKNQTLKWTNSGYIGKEDLLNKIQQ